ncbi:MAG: hypothetical protein WCI12_06015 [Actinomycetes bacterium]
MREVPRIDIEVFRSLRHVTVIRRPYRGDLIVLGSAQALDILADSHVPAVRRHGGGGAVLATASMRWVEIWIPSHSVLHHASPSDGLAVAGEVWRSALAILGAKGLVAARVRQSSPSVAVCFAGVGHGEVLDADGAKLVGLTAWRSREGSLYQGAVYQAMDLSLPSLLAVGVKARQPLDRALANNATDLDRTIGDHVSTEHINDAITKVLAHKLGSERLGASMMAEAPGGLVVTEGTRADATDSLVQGGP